MVIPITELPHFPRLAADYICHYGKVREFYNGDFRDFTSFRRQTESVRARRIRREDLAAVLREQNQSYGCGPRTLDQVEKIVRDEACAVVTGQQVGLFLGPLYTIYKALTAIKLAESLNQHHLGSFVPIFWLASEDHDLAEIDHITFLNQNNELEDVCFPYPSDELKIPASKIILPSEIVNCLRQLREATLDSEFKENIIEHLSDAYQPGRSMAEAFGRWMIRLFDSYGLIIIDASHPRLKELGSEVFYREIAEESPSTREALAASEKLRQAGYEAQVHLHEGILNLFYAERQRRAIQWKEGVYSIKETPDTFQKQELLALAAEKPSLFSPNVLLRPLYQDALLPTVTYVAGPGEIAYFAQMRGIYEKFRLPMPVIYPRKTVTIVEKNIDHILKKYNLTIPDLWRDAAGIIGDMAKKQIPDSIQKTLRLVHEHLEQDFEPLKREISAIEPTLKDTADLAKRKIEHSLKFLEKKIVQAAKTQDDIAIRQFEKATHNLYPRRQLQERVFNIVPYLIKYGHGLIDRWAQAIDLDEYDHQVMAM